MSVRIWNTIQFKIIAFLSLIFIIICVMLVMFNFKLFEHELIKNLSDTAGNLCQSIESGLETAMLSGRQEHIQRAIDKLGKDEHVVNLFITNKSGIVRAASNHRQLGDTLSISQSSCQSCHSVQASQTQTTIVYKTDEILRSVRPIYNNPACYACHPADGKINGVLFLDYSLTTYNQQLAYYKRMIILLSGGIIVLLAGLTFWLLHRMIISRIRGLVRRIQSIEAWHIGTSHETTGKDEFSTLGTSINQMNQRIQESFQQIRRDRDYLQSIINSVQDGLIVIDKNFNIELANDAFLRFINKRSDDVLGTRCHHIVGKHHCDPKAKEHLCPSQAVFRTGKFVQIISPEDGEPALQTLEISASPVFDENGHVIHSIEIIRDITEKKRMEQELLQSEKLALLGRLAAGVAHEINNPLATILMYAEGILGRMQDAGNKPVKNEKWLTEYLNQIEKYIFRCKAIIERLLTFSRPAVVVQEVFDLNETVNETVQMVLHQIEQEGKNVTLLLTDKPVYIRGEQNQIGQLVLNLLINSLDAIEIDGEIRVSTIQKQDKICLSVEDNGIGIDKNILNHIFEPFFTTKDVGKGTGLGLAICQRIVHEHNGIIKVNSEEKKGSRFELVFPAVNKENE